MDAVSDFLTYGVSHCTEPMDALLQEDALRPCSAVHRATAYEFIERWRCLAIGAGVEHGVSARHQLCKKTFRRWLLHSQLKMRLSRRRTGVTEDAKKGPS